MTDHDDARTFLATVWPRTLPFPVLDDHPFAKEVVIDIMVAFARRQMMQAAFEKKPELKQDD